MWQYDYLCHHGIKGQRWGIRRFQNEDGTLTAAGLRRKAKLEKKLKKFEPNNPTPKEKPKSVSEYSNEELKEMTERLRLENEYKKQIKDAKQYVTENAQTISKGKKIVDGMKAAGDFTKSAASFTAQAINVYNDYARVMNSVAGKNYKLVQGVNHFMPKKDDDKKDK